MKPLVRSAALHAKCRVCKQKADVYLKSYNLPLCHTHYIEFIINRVKKAISAYKMIPSSNAKLLVALSGGKDSLTVAYILKSLGYNIKAMFIDLGIPKYSQESREIVEHFVKQFDIPLKIVELEKEIGYTLPQIVKRLKRPPCSVCGSIKRYLMNRESQNYDMLVTGHNLSDETAFLLSNLLFWKYDYILHQQPVLPELGGYFKRKIKPLVLISDEEVKYFADLIGIEYVKSSCPLGRTAKLHKYKELLAELENSMPGTRLRFLNGFLDFKEKYISENNTKEEVLPPNRCVNCGYPTYGKLCFFCSLKQSLES